MTVYLLVIFMFSSGAKFDRVELFKTKKSCEAYKFKAHEISFPETHCIKQSAK